MCITYDIVCGKMLKYLDDSFVVQDYTLQTVILNKTIISQNSVVPGSQEIVYQ